MRSPSQITGQDANEMADSEWAGSFGLQGNNTRGMFVRQIPSSIYSRPGKKGG